MRLICPNCDAQYEVDDGAIPEAGRDVQCSNCGHAWFQMPEPARPVETADLYREPEPEVPAALWQGEAEPERVSEIAEAEADAGDPPLPARAIDESVLAVLREEAEREARARREDARRAGAGGLELQGDLGLPPPVQAVAQAVSAPVLTEAERRIATLKGKPLPAPKAAARRDLLPDIEEINSTLRPSERAETMDEFSMSGTDDEPAAKSGFRSGFFMVLLIAVLVVALYVMAPRIAEQMPGTAGAMTAYVEAVDAARGWLDGLIRRATSLLNGLAGGA